MGRRREQLVGPGKIGGADAAGNQTIVADAMESLEQHVHEEAPDDNSAAASVMIL
jgi:hypothetical protein